ncbi:hypothetical protein [Flavobacterium sp. I3-2]|nr:hypothetical protein [Flavobacterium sp. I3-2]
MTEYEKFTKLIAKIELGSAPSVGYFEELILKARKAIDIETTKTSHL